MRRRPVAEWTVEQLREILKRARMALGEEDYKVLNAVVETLDYLTYLAKDKQAAEMYRILGASKSEKLRNIIRLIDPDAKTTADNQDQTEPRAAEPVTPPAELPGNATPSPIVDKTTPGAAEDGVSTPEVDNPAAGKKKPKGHGRNGADAFAGARQIAVPLTSMKAGDRCRCGMGNLYPHSEQPLIRILGGPPVGADVYWRQSLRCNTCGEVYTAEPPAGVGTEKYDATSVSMVAVLKYGSGFPFYRLERLQASLAIPLPASTQWEIVCAGSVDLQPAFDELVRQAAQGEVLYNDDTSVRILEFLKAGQVQQDPKFPGRTGVFTSGIVSTRESRKIALFFSGRKHAGENLADVLAQRAKDLPPPIQMCDALSRNLPRQFEVILANCLAHARRHVVENVPNFPQECQHMLKLLAEVYHNDAIAREQAMTSQVRLEFHQAQSGPVMERLKNWCDEQLAQRRVEPNSGLGSAIRYLQNHWTPLTQFLRVPGAPLDSNIVERALKRAILHRKNSLYYKTQRGAAVGDLYMSLIHTCQLQHANPFDYLTSLYRNAGRLRLRPSEWMPWNYREALAATGPSPPISH